MLIISQCLFRICSFSLLIRLLPYLLVLPNTISYPIDDVSSPKFRYSGRQQQLPCTEDRIEEIMSDRKNEARRRIPGNYFYTL